MNGNDFKKIRTALMLIVALVSLFLTYIVGQEKIHTFFSNSYQKIKNKLHRSDYPDTLPIITPPHGITQIDSNSIYSPFNEKEIPTENKTEQDSHEIVEDTTTSCDTLVGLRPDMEGKYLSEIQDNFFGFTSTSNILSEFSPQADREYIRLTSKRIYDDYFEIQKIKRKDFIVGFITAETCDKIPNIHHLGELELILNALKTDDFNSLISIPFASISNVDIVLIKINEQETIQALRITTTEVNPNCSAHGAKK